MPSEEKYTPLPRFQVVPLLAQRFARDYEDTIQHYDLPQQLELTEHLLHILELFKQHEHNKPEALYQQFQEKEETLLKKYGKTLKHYFDRQFDKYFDFPYVLSEKAIYPQEEYNRLSMEQQSLTVNEINQFIRVCYNTLHNARIFLYLRMEPESARQEAKTALLPDPDEADKEMTKARQLLAIYYLLKAGFSIEHRDSHSVSAVARFAHLLTGSKLTNLQNSDIYKKYALMPHYKRGEQLIADLQFIRPFFADLNIQEAVSLIDEEIRHNEKRLPKK